jgi:hypothetical protein
MTLTPLPDETHWFTALLTTGERINVSWLDFTEPTLLELSRVLTDKLGAIRRAARHQH